MTTQMHKSKSQTFPLSKLILSAFNVRVEKSSNESIASLAASIDAHGQLENLVVIPEKKKMGVVAGGRRLAALHLLLKQKKIKADYPVRCEVVDPEHALELSAAENSNREAMNPIDEYEAFRKMIDNGRSVEDVAAAFGVSSVVVQRRLKLASLSPKLLERYRSGEIDNLDVLMAFALTDDHEKQEKVWKQLEKYRRNASTIRSLLAEDSLHFPNDALAKFVGIKAYTKAGGQLRHDLFSDTEGEAQMLDVPLVHTLAQAKLDAKVAKLKAEGFAWAEGRIDFDFNQQSKFSRVPMIRGDATKAQTKRLAEIAKRLDEIEELTSKVANDGGDEDTPEFQAMLDEEESLQDEQRDIEDALQIPDPKCESVAGAIVTIDHRGQFEVHKGLVRPEDKKLVKEAAQQARINATATGAEDDDSESQESGYSERTNRALTSHLTLALRCEVGKKPSVALALMVATLVHRVFERVELDDEAPITVEGESRSMDDFSPDIGTCKASTTLSAERTRWNALLPKDGNVFEWALSLPQEDLLNLFTFCVSLTVNAVVHRGMPNEGIRALMTAVSLDMADYWRPTALNYLGSINKTMILDAVTQGVDESTAKSLVKCKKGELIEKAEASLASTRWVPTMFKVS